MRKQYAKLVSNFEFIAFSFLYVLLPINDINISTLLTYRYNQCHIAEHSTDTLYASVENLSRKKTVQNNQSQRNFICHSFS